MNRTLMQIAGIDQPERRTRPHPIDRMLAPNDFQAAWERGFDAAVQYAADAERIAEERNERARVILRTYKEDDEARQDALLVLEGEG